MESQEIANVGVVPQFNITQATLRLSVIAHASFKVELIGDAKLGESDYTANLNYNDPNGTFKVDIAGKPGAATSLMRASDIKQTLMKVVAPADLKVALSPKSADAEVQKLIDKLSLENLILDNSAVKMTFVPEPVILITGTSSFYKTKDASVEIVLSTNKGKVEVVVSLIFLKEDNAMNALSKILALPQGPAISSLKSNFEVNSVGFVLSRNDLTLQDAP